MASVGHKPQEGWPSAVMSYLPPVDLVSAWWSSFLAFHVSVFGVHDIEDGHGLASIMSNITIMFCIDITKRVMSIIAAIALSQIIQSLQRFIFHCFVRSQFLGFSPFSPTALAF